MKNRNQQSTGAWEGSGQTALALQCSPKGETSGSERVNTGAWEHRSLGRLGADCIGSAMQPEGRDARESASPRSGQTALALQCSPKGETSGSERVNTGAWEHRSLGRLGADCIGSAMQPEGRDARESASPRSGQTALALQCSPKGETSGSERVNTGADGSRATEPADRWPEARSCGNSDGNRA